MVDFARIQNRIYYGYGKAAIRLGTAHTIYRTSTGLNPIQIGNLIDNQLISIDEDLKYTKSRKYNDMTWYFLPEDGLGLVSPHVPLQNYDYMVGGTTTYFIADVAPDDRFSPPLCVECNAIISISGIRTTLTPGINTYQEYTLSTPIVSACPVALLQYTRMDKENMGLPTSGKMPTYNITMPDFDDITILTGDEIDDNKGRRLVVIVAEQTKQSLGIRIIAQEKGT